MNRTILIQERLRPALPTVLGCRDYREQEQLLVRVDRILRESGVERLFVGLSLERYEAAAAGPVSQRDLVRQSERSEKALRCTVLKNILGEDYREMSVRLAQCGLFRWFCKLPELEAVRVPGKSTLQEYANWLPHGEMEKVLGLLREAVSDEQRAREIGLEAELDMEVAWVDTTCLKANIHFPADWVLLRDAVRTLIKNILTIRRHGLKVRMPEPGDFIVSMNAQAMAMSAAARRKPGSKKARKRVLRAMKKICRTVREHAERYERALEERWSETDLTRKEAEVILRRMRRVLEQLPEATRQAHERIIGERAVANADKILSLYEGDIHVIVRGKAGADVEFGNSLFVAETVNGLILDHELRRGISPGDAKWLQERYPKMKEASGDRLCGAVGDRGFDSAGSRKMLQEQESFNGLCPRDSREMQRRLREDEAFIGAQKRRAQTEGRIGILKNVFLQGVPRAKGFRNRELQVDWAVLAHNLWIVARCPWAREEQAAAEAA
jgi:hypothetical protein